jgi:hypothetical protein
MYFDFSWMQSYLYGTSRKLPTKSTRAANLAFANQRENVTRNLAHNVTFVHTTRHVNREEKMAKTWGARRCHAPLCHFENFQVNILKI